MEIRCRVIVLKGLAEVVARTGIDGYNEKHSRTAKVSIVVKINSLIDILLTLISLPKILIHQLSKKHLHP